jgi:hypothetical protein
VSSVLYNAACLGDRDKRISKNKKGKRKIKISYYDNECENKYIILKAKSRQLTEDTSLTLSSILFSKIIWLSFLVAHSLSILSNSDTIFLKSMFFILLTKLSSLALDRCRFLSGILSSSF